jgi:hypothetical protein
VEYFNPFRNVQIDPALPLEDLAKVAHSMGEVVGLGLRNLAHCPVELNLMPKSTLKRQQFNQKKPYLAAAVFCLILVFFAFGWFYDRTAGEKSRALEDLKARAMPLASSQNQLNAANNQLRGARMQLEQYENWIDDRFYWGAVFSKLREILLTVENKKDAEFKAPTGVWIEKFEPAGSQAATEQPPGTAPPPRRGRGRGAGSGQALTTEITSITLGCRAVNARLVTGEATANTILIGSLLEELKAATNYFIPDGTEMKGDQRGGDTDLTIGFDVVVKLKHPLN